MNKERLSLKCMAKGFHITDLPAKIGISVSTFYRKCKTESFTIKEVKSIKDTLSLTDKDLKAIFFDRYVS